MAQKSPKSPDEQRRVNSQQGVKKQDEQTVSKCPTGKKPFTEMTALSKGMSRTNFSTLPAELKVVFNWKVMKAADCIRSPNRTV